MDKRPVSPRSGAPLPIGKKFEAGNEARKKGQKGGKRSGEVRAARKTMKEELLQLLAVKIPDKNTGKPVETQAALTLSLIEQALKGNTKAYEIIRDTIGEKPTENVNITAADFSALEEAFGKLEGK